MPAWMLSALRLLGIGLAGEAGLQAVTGSNIPGLIPFGSSGGLSLPFGIGGGDKRRPRRRKKMLSKSDMVDIAFLGSMLSQAQLAKVIAARVAAL